MQSRRRTGSSQPELFVRSKRPTIAIEENHRLVRLTEQLDWTKLEVLVETIRERKLKSRAGRPPHLRALIGVLVLRATRKMTYRETEDQVRHYAPARYLCALTECEWTPDTNTIQDFEQLLGEDGIREVNAFVLKEAVALGLADPSVAVADTTAQEAAIPYPNEMGLMSAFLASVWAASRRAGTALKQFVGRAADLFRAGKAKLREYRLFAKDKSKKAKDKMTAEMVALVEKVQGQLDSALKQAAGGANRLTGYSKVAYAKVVRLQQAMRKLVPQIRHWLKTGHVAAGKIINVHIPELYSVVRGKVGKTVEFGLQWGFTRLRGGFLLARMGLTRADCIDSKYAIQAVDDLTALFGKAPHAYAYDRGGYSRQNVDALKQRGVQHVGLAPRGRAEWDVSHGMRKKLVNERAQVEGGIGAVKSARYGFHRPAARSAAMIAASGQRAVLGFNLNKLAREFAKRQGIALVG